MSTGVVIVAGGAGTRLGSALPKAFVPLAGRPLLAYAVERACQLPDLACLVIVAPAAQADPHHPLWAQIELPAGTRIVAGGRQRGDSVLAGLRALPPEVEIVLVHDAARCLAPTSLFARVRDAMRSGAVAVVPGIPVVDTVKAVDEHGTVIGTPDRAALRAIQTPQAFDRATLERAHHVHGSLATDDAGLVERLGQQVRVVDGDAAALKITIAQDFAPALWHLDQQVHDGSEHIDRVGRPS